MTQSFGVEPTFFHWFVSRLSWKRLYFGTKQKSMLVKGFFRLQVETKLCPWQPRRHISPEKGVPPDYSRWLQSMLVHWVFCLHCHVSFQRVYILLMEEILHQLIWLIYHYLQGVIHPRWCRISSINSMYTPILSPLHFCIYLFFHDPTEDSQLLPLYWTGGAREKMAQRFNLCFYWVATFVWGPTVCLR